MEEREWETTFGGTTYIVTLTQSNGLVVFELEDMSTNNRWSGEFTSQCKSHLSSVLFTRFVDKASCTMAKCTMPTN